MLKYGELKPVFSTVLFKTAQVSYGAFYISAISRMILSHRPCVLNLFLFFFSVCTPTSPCQNGGTCDEVTDTCMCPTGFFGDLCAESELLGCVSEWCMGCLSTFPLRWPALDGMCGIHMAFVDTISKPT